MSTTWIGCGACSPDLPCDGGETRCAKLPWPPTPRREQWDAERWRTALDTKVVSLEAIDTVIANSKATAPPKGQGT